MSRFGRAIALGILALPLACGDKLLPPDPTAPKGGAGGTTTVPLVDAGGGTGTQTSTDTSTDAGDETGASSSGMDALSATNTSTSTSTAVSVSYARDIQPLLEKYCTTCHSPSGGQRPYLDTYAAAKSGAANSLDDVQSGSMPTTGPAMQPAEVALFEAWVTALEPP
jgi:hypothetical protein